MKTELTKTCEKALFNTFNKLGHLITFECQIGFAYGTSEKVDAILYRTSEHDITCFEIKVSEKDFNSKNKLSFMGNRNYYVMPINLYLKLKDKLEKIYNESGTGTYVVYDNWLVECKIRCKKQELRYDKEILLASMVRSRWNKTNLELVKK